MNMIASLDNFLPIHIFEICIFQSYEQILSYGHPRVQSRPNKKGFSVFYLCGLQVGFTFSIK